MGGSIAGAENAVNEFGHELNELEERWRISFSLSGTAHNGFSKRIARIGHGTILGAGGGAARIAPDVDLAADVDAADADFGNFAGPQAVDDHFGDEADADTFLDSEGDGFGVAEGARPVICI